MHRIAIVALALLAALPLTGSPASARQDAAEQTSPELVTDRISIPPRMLSTPGAGAQLCSMLVTLTGAESVEWLANPPSIVIRGTPEQVIKATNHVHSLRAEIEARENQGTGVRDPFDLEFAGGTVDEYLKAIEQLSGFRNVVVDQAELASLRVPAVRMRRISPEGAVRVLENLNFELDGAPARIRLSLVNQRGGDTQSVFVASLESKRSAGRSREPVFTRVFDLSGLQRVEPEQLKALLEAIGVGIELAGQSKDFATKFHPGSGLFFARGTPGELDVVDQTIGTKLGRNRSARQVSDAPPSEPQPTHPASQPAPESKR